MRQDGVWSDRRAHAPLLHGEGGTIEVRARLLGAAPAPGVHQHADLYSGFFGVGAVCAALFRVCLIGNPLRLFDRWMSGLGVEPTAAPADDHAAGEAVVAAASRFPDAASFAAALTPHRMVSAVVQPAARLLDTEWARQRGVVGTAAPGVRVPAAPWRSSGADIGITGHAAPIGAHTRQVLAAFLGLSDRDIDALAAEGVVAG